MRTRTERIIKIVVYTCILSVVILIIRDHYKPQSTQNMRDILWYECGVKISDSEEIECIKGVGSCMFYRVGTTQPVVYVINNGVYLGTETYDNLDKWEVRKQDILRAREEN